MTKSSLSTTILVASTLIMTSLPFMMRHQNEELPELKPDSPQLKQRDTSIVFPKHAVLSPALLVKKEKADTTSVPLAVSEVSVQVQVLGHIATTRISLLFYNQTDRVLEGEFVCPLGEDQNMSYFAFETEGKLREGVVVEKAKAREVFESVLRRNVDPGLLEWTKGNNFRSRIYPIPAHGYKKIIVGFDQELISAGRSSIYQQPLLFKDKLKAFDLDVEVLKQEVKPELYGDERINLNFGKWQDVWKAHAHEEQTAMAKNIAFELPVNPAGTVYTQTLGGDSSYFYINLQPEKYLVPKPKATKICMLWDASASGAGRDTSKEFKLLEAYFQSLGNVSVDLVAFSNTPQALRHFDISQGRWSALHSTLSRMVYDGGSCFGALDLSSKQYDEYLLFSDGMQNFGRDDFKTGTKPAYTICSSLQADYSLLKRMALRTGGVFINLAATTLPDAQKLLSQAPYQFISATWAGNNVSHVYPSMPKTIANGLSVCGIIKAPEAEIILNFGVAGEVMHQQKVKIQRTVPLAGKQIGRHWAQLQISELDLNPKANEAQITALGKEFGIVTRYTSLLILDAVEDYIRYRVEPPTPEMKERYFAALKEEEAVKRDHQTEHLNQVWEEYQGLREWYSRQFSGLCAAKNKEPRTTDDTMIMMTDSLSVSMDAMPAAAEVRFSPPVVLQEGVVMGTNANYYFSASNANSATTALADISVEGRRRLMEEAKEHEGENLKSDIALNNWSSNAPYMTDLKKAPAAAIYETYLKLRINNLHTPAFYVDAADYLYQQGQKALAVRVLSNLAELETENAELLRMLAHRLQQWQQNDLAIETFRQIREIRSEEPQAYRDLGLALEQAKKYQDAVNELCHVVNKNWDGRFPGIEVIAINEINHIHAKAPEVQLDSLDRRFRNPMQTDVRVVINWDSDNCDMDLWVTDPCGEKCFYQNKLTQLGGRLSNDFTGGYGPEEFLLKRGAAGKYLIQVNYYGTRQQTLFGPTTVHAELYTNYGKPNEVKKDITLRLSDNKEVVDLGTLTFAK
ncbi:MAG: DUF2135 domain-containing protein [Bacteroidetes bacterium]|nr:DUF2135 domain-containing protein [Bacteroidota bacterium]